MKRIFLVLISFTLSINFLKAQGQGIDQTFRPVIYASLVASQVDGDTYAGYSKPGFMFGAGINRQLSKLFEVECGLTLIQKGARHIPTGDAASSRPPASAF